MATKKNSSPKWKQAKPAMPGAVKALEDAIGRKLPPDYRKFLLSGNGGKAKIGNHPVELYAVERVLQETDEMDVDAVSTDIYLIGDWNTRFIALDLREKRTAFVTYGAIDGSTTKLGTTLATTLESLAAKPTNPQLAQKLIKKPDLRGFEIVEMVQLSTQYTCAFAVRGQKALTVGEQTRVAKLWDWEHNRLIRTLKGKLHDPRGANISPDGSRGLVWNHAFNQDPNNILAWDLKTGKQLCEFVEHQERVMGAIFVDEKTVVSAALDGSLYRWHSDSGKLTEKTKFGNDVQAITLSPDRAKLAIAGSRTIEFRSPVSLRRTQRLCDTEQGARLLRFSADGQRLLVNFPRLSQILSTATGEVLSRATGRMEGYCGAFLLADQYFFGEIDTYNVSLIETASGKLAWKKRVEGGSFSQIAITDDGQHLLSYGCFPGVVRVWQIRKA